MARNRKSLFKRFWLLYEFIGLCLVYIIVYELYTKIDRIDTFANILIVTFITLLLIKFVRFSAKRFKRFTKARKKSVNRREKIGKKN